MASNSPESPSKKRKQSEDQSKRDQPLFASRLPQLTLQQPPEFLTDSLNTSYIPSPSPPKPPTRSTLRVTPRQAGDRKSLTAAFRASSSVNDRSKPSSPLSTPDQKRTESIRKPRPVQTEERSRLRSPGKAAPQSAPSRSPTPRRGRPEAVQSPAKSESSPGRGYAEAYQRIVEEENLAQEDSIEDVETDDNNYPGDQSLQDLDRLRHRNSNGSASPMSLKASRRASPRGVSDFGAKRDAMEDKENSGRGSGSESGISHMENVTDTSLDSGSSQYLRDMQRLNGALRSGPKAFSKARLGDKASLTTENLRRRSGSIESLGSSFSGGSRSNRGSDPSVNVPRAWGRKAKPGKDWLSRINNNRSGKLTGDVTMAHGSGDEMIAENEKKNFKDSVDDWVVAAADTPLPSGGNDSLQTAPSASKSTSTNLPERNSPLDRRRDWQVNDDEFTARSLQVSDSPPIRLRNANLDRIRDREIESLERQAVTTNRLDELREQKSEERLSRRSSTGSTSEIVHDRKRDTPQSQGKRSSGRAGWRSKLDDSIYEAPLEVAQEAGEPIPDTPIVIYRTKSNNLIGLAESKAKRTRVREASQTPKMEQKDSHDLLKRLARATSDSPGPSEHSVEEAPQNLERKASHGQNQTPQISKPIGDCKTPVVTGAWVDPTIQETPKHLQPETNLKTPFVTGAWIDTPLPTGGRGPLMPTPVMEEDKELTIDRPGASRLIQKLSPNVQAVRPETREQEALKYTGPPLPHSALEEIIKDAKAGKIPALPSTSDSEEDPTLHLGDSTIQSLEDLIANDTDISTVLLPTPTSQETSPPSSDLSPATHSQSNSARKSSRLKDLQSYTQILSRLTNLAPSIRASKDSIASLERAVTSSPNVRTTGSRAMTGSGSGCVEAGEYHDFIWPCQQCGCPGRMEPDLDALLSMRDNLTSIRITIPRLWRWRKDDWRPRLTWLGVLTVLGWGLVLGEMWARDRYCHKFYAPAGTISGFGVNIHAPRPPFVLFKVVSRALTTNSILSPLYIIARILIKLLSSVAGYLFGVLYGDEAGSVDSSRWKGAKPPVSRDPRIPRPDWGPDLTFMDDEYL